MATFVAVAGAWLGAWAWDEVAAHLRADGHDVHPVTLSGLAEKAGLPAGQQTHVQDIVEAVERSDLAGVVLVGHSCSGIPVGQAAERIGPRLRRVVYVDASVPADGRSFADSWPPVLDALRDGVWPPLTAPEFAGQGLTDEQVARIVSKATPHPAATITEPARLAGSPAELPTTYVKCLLDGDEPSPDVAALLKSDRWSLVTLDTGHWPMFSEPEKLASVLAASALDR